MIEFQPNRHFVFLTGLLAFTTLWATVAAAGPFEPARIPANTKWVHHVDLEAMQASVRWVCSATADVAGKHRSLPETQDT